MAKSPAKLSQCNTNTVILQDVEHTVETIIQLGGREGMKYEGINRSRIQGTQCVCGGGD